MSEQMRAFGYVCPKCGKSVYGERSLFAISAAPMEIECECGKSALRTEFDGLRYRVEVPCGLCGGIHSAEITNDAMLHGRGVGLSCSQNGQLCAYIGESRAVAPKLSNLEELYEKNKKDSESDDTFLDNVIMYEVLSEIKDIAARDGISCECGSHKWGMKIRHASVELFCKDCGARLMVPASTSDDLDALCCQMKLKIMRA